MNCFEVMSRRLFILLLGALFTALADQDLTPAAAGPYHTSSNRILDARGKPFLIRGTELPPFTGKQVSVPRFQFGPHSATTLSSIRQRFNMNAVLLPVNTPDSFQEFADLAATVRTANQLGLLVILAAPGAGAAFWRQCTRTFRDYPDIMFDIAKPELLPVARESGARQLVLLASQPSGEPNVIYEAPGRLTALETEAERDRLFHVAQQVPILINDWDLQLDEASGICRSLPTDPSAVTSLIEARLAYFDAHAISWTASSFTPGKLITDYRYLFATTLENGWTCGHPADPPAGMGLVLQVHLWGTQVRGLFTVANPTGGMLLARGGIASAYGMILARNDADGGAHPPRWLAGVSVEVTDAAGTTRQARLLHLAPGWAYLNFVVPPESAAGPARISVVRSDGTRAEGSGTIVDVSPGLYTGTNDGHGPVSGRAERKMRSGKIESTPTSRCRGTDCETVAIILHPGAPVTLHILGTGFRNLGPHPDLRAEIGGVPVPVIGVRRTASPGVDELTLQVPETLDNPGETDLLFWADGVVSNVVRLRIESAYHWDLPKGFPLPPVPAGNPMSDAKVHLGRFLFYDKRLSGDQTMSCGTCHRQEFAFTDGKAHPSGITGQPHPRNTMTLVNVAYSNPLTWSNPTLRSLEEQALTPIYGRHPVELGLAGHTAEVLRQFRQDALYKSLFRDAFHDESDPFTIANVTRAIACFERTIISARSPYDRFHYGGDEGAISDSAKRGEVLFFLERTACFHCHGGFNFSDNGFHNTGLYNLPGRFSYPSFSLGVYEHTGRESDVGRFKAPSLRNIAVTAPYMHDGSIETLEGVLDHYAAGGRGRDNPNKDRRIHGFSLTPQNRIDLIAFLRSLTDDELLHDPRFADPWPNSHSKSKARDGT